MPSARISESRRSGMSGSDLGRLEGVRKIVLKADPLVSGLRLALLDLRGRLRTPGSLFALGLMVALTALYLPEHSAAYVTLSINGARGFYNSAWVGATVALLSSFVFSMVGFFLCRGLLESERRLGLERWTEATPLPLFFRLWGKTVGHFGYLALLCLTVALSAPWIQSLRAETPGLDWAALWTPTLLLTLPTMFGVAVLAVTFDRIPLLRSGLGTGIFILLWTLAGALGVAAGALPDPFGAGPLLHTLLEAGGGNVDGGAGLTLGLTPANLPTRFLWNGMSWPLEYLLSRLGWVLLGLGLLYAVSRTSLHLGVGARANGHSRLERSRVWMGGRHPVLGELNLALKSLHPGYGVLLLALSLGGAVTPLLLPFVLLALLPLYATLSSAVYRYGLSPLLGSLPLGGKYLLAWRLIALTLLTLICITPAVLSQVGGGQPEAAWGLLVLPLFSASLALSSAILSRGSTLFEALFIVFWYLGPVSGWPALDYTRAPVALAALGMSAVLILWAAVIQHSRHTRGPQ